MAAKGSNQENVERQEQKQQRWHIIFDDDSVHLYFSRYFFTSVT
jgi:hypothetical protein